MTSIIVTIISLVRDLFGWHCSGKFGESDTETLVFCRTAADVEYFDAKGRFDGHTIVACDNPKGRDQAAGLEWVDKVVFTENKESIYTVAPTVKEHLDSIGEWLREQSDDRISSDLLFWQRHPEGRRTAVRLQDAFILVDSYQELLNDCRVNQLVIRRRASSRWEDRLLLSVASACDVNVTTVEGLKFRIAARGDLVPASEFIGGAPDPLWLPRSVINSLLTGKLFFDVVTAYLKGATGTTGTGSERDPTVVLQLFSSAEKHIENVMPLLGAFNGSDYRAVALTWRAGDAARSVLERGHAVIELESYLSLEIIQDVATAIQFAWFARSEAESFRRNPNLQYKGVALGAHLWPQMREFLWYHLLRRVVFVRLFEEFAATTDMAALKLSSGGNSDMGQLSAEIAADHGDPLTFHYNLGAMLDWPYFEERCDLYLASGEIEAKRLEQMGVPPDRIATTGHGRYDSLSGFMQEHSVMSSRSRLGLHSDSSIYIFYAPNGIVRGMHSMAEQSRVLNCLAAFAESHPKATVFAKAHPNSDETMFRRWAANADCDNVAFIGDELLPYHCLNAADVVVTKFSTVGVEAMLFDCHVVSVALDGENRFQSVFGDAAERVQTIDQLQSSLKRLSASDRPAAQNQAARQRFLNRQFSTSDNANERMCDAILARLDG